MVYNGKSQAKKNDKPGGNARKLPFLDVLIWEDIVRAPDLPASHAMNMDCWWLFNILTTGLQTLTYPQPQLKTRLGEQYSHLWPLAVPEWYMVVQQLSINANVTCIQYTLFTFYLSQCAMDDTFINKHYTSYTIVTHSGYPPPCPFPFQGSKLTPHHYKERKRERERDWSSFKTQLDWVCASNMVDMFAFFWADWF